MWARRFYCSLQLLNNDKIKITINAIIAAVCSNQRDKRTKFELNANTLSSITPHDVTHRQPFRYNMNSYRYMFEVKKKKGLHCERKKNSLWFIFCKFFAKQLKPNFCFIHLLIITWQKILQNLFPNSIENYH